MKNIQDSNFKDFVANNDKPVLVDFWAEWCGPCKMIAPILDELSNEMGDKIEFAKINIDENPNTPTEYSIRGIPTFMLFKNGEVIDTKVGALQKTDLKAWLNAHI